MNEFADAVLTGAPPRASDADIAAFRRIRLEQKEAAADERRRGRLGNLLKRANRMAMRPSRLYWSAKLGLAAALEGTRRSGRAILARDGIGVPEQFAKLFTAGADGEISADDFYLHRLYLPERWRAVSGTVSAWTALSAQRWLIDRSDAADYNDLADKRRFAPRCRELGLPAVPVIAQFTDGHAASGLKLPAKDLFSKRADLYRGIGAEAWRCEEGGARFVNALTGTRLSAAALIEHLREQSRAGPIVLQERVRNHAGLAPLTNGALSTMRIVTCVSPSGSIDLMPAVIRCPTGKAVIDNLAQGGLGAPIDLKTGAISGPSVKKDKTLGVVSIERHPDSGQEFRGFVIPYFAEALELARRAHANFPSVAFVGWDIAILPEGPVLVEANAVFNTDLTVLPHGIALADTQFIPYYNHHWRRAKRVGPRRRGDRFFALWP